MRLPGSAGSRRDTPGVTATRARASLGTMTGDVRCTSHCVRFRLLDPQQKNIARSPAQHDAMICTVSSNAATVAQPSMTPCRGVGKTPEGTRWFTLGAEQVRFVVPGFGGESPRHARSSRDTATGVAHNTIPRRTIALLWESVWGSGRTQKIKSKEPVMMPPRSKWSGCTPSTTTRKSWSPGTWAFMTDMSGELIGDVVVKQFSVDVNMKHAPKGPPCPPAWA